jgi:hypothetical protein
MTTFCFDVYRPTKKKTKFQTETCRLVVLLVWTPVAALLPGILVFSANKFISELHIIKIPPWLGYRYGTKLVQMGHFIDNSGKN